jgi:hypothetical protein
VHRREAHEGRDMSIHNCRKKKCRTEAKEKKIQSLEIVHKEGIHVRS